MNPFIHNCTTPEDLADKFALQLISWINETNDNTFHLALSGGRTPTLLISLLADKYRNDVNWQKIHFWWSDERMVPANNPESNFGMVNDHLFSVIKLPENKIHNIRGEADPDGEAKRYGSEISSIVPLRNGWPYFDLIMLGLGDDGHTASIFPNQIQLMESDGITAITIHPNTGQKRITLTGRVLNNAKRVAFLVSGVSKASVYDKIIHQDNSALIYPAYLIRPKGELHWFADKAATLKGK